MKYKTDDLEGALLDAAVAKAARLNGTLAAFHPSTDWRYGGPIIERSGCFPRANDNPGAKHLGAYLAETPAVFQHFGQTPLIAAMRAYVASEIGLEVELP